MLKDGSQFGIELSYKEQPSPDGLAQAFILGEDFIKNDDVCLVLGDNIFYGAGLQNIIKESVRVVKDEKKAVIFGNYVNDPERYGVAEFDNDGNVIEKAVLGTRNKIQSVDYAKLVPLLVGAIQELRAEIELLKSK